MSADNKFFSYLRHTFFCLLTSLRVQVQKDSFTQQAIYRVMLASIKEINVYTLIRFNLVAMLYTK